MYNELCGNRSINRLTSIELPRVELPKLDLPKKNNKKIKDTFLEFKYKNLGGQYLPKPIELPKVNVRYSLADNLLKKQKVEIFKNIGIEKQNGYRKEGKDLLELSNNALIKDYEKYSEYHFVREEKDVLGLLVKLQENQKLPFSKKDKNGKRYYYCIIKFAKRADTATTTNNDNRELERVEPIIIVRPAYPEPGSKHSCG